MNEDNRLKVLLEFSEKIKTNLINIEEDFWFLLFETAQKIVPKADYGAIFLNVNGKIKFLKIKGHNSEEIKKLDIPAHKFINLEDKNVIVIEKDIVNLSEGEIFFDKLNKFTSPIKETITFNFYFDRKFISGISLDIKKESEKKFDETDKRLLNILLNFAEYFYQSEKYALMKKSHTRELAITLVKILELRDKYTQGHSESVADISLLIAEEMGLSIEEKHDAYWTGLLHDIGKISVPEEILNKPSRLNTLEFGIIKNHSKWGYQILKQNPWLETIPNFVLSHHERWDGAGYPNGIKGNQIPLISQIVSVADSYNAMVSDRAYRKGMDSSKAFGIIIENSGEQFSPEAVFFFKKIIEKGYLKNTTIKKKLNYQVLGFEKMI